MDWQTLTSTLFGPNHGVRAEGPFLHGTVQFNDQPITVVGTAAHAPIGAELALAQARVVLDTVREHPGRTLFLLIDTQGQHLRQREELLGINRAMAHLGMAIDLARRKGHQVIGLVYDQALSGGFITSGLVANACDALPNAEIRVMRIPAMSRVTKLPESLLEQLSESNPVFAPGVANYLAMGGVRKIWESDLRQELREALATASPVDSRAAAGEARGGRRLASAVSQRIMEAP